ncbi:hypothetical protein PENSPDRAFT_751843 [Peniophora sp. CONT]|nr:hypothetical protein PENSPDRAFT_751843 [Peniophora sp. CONT]
MSDRQELLRNAVAFLNDPKTQGSPLAQRVQFLQAKGLTPQEIDIAMGQAAPAASGPSTYASPYPSAYAPMGAYPPGPQPWDWRDYFITAVVSGSIAYGAAALARKYLMPHLQPPSATAYEEDRDALTAQFDAAEALLREIQADTVAVKAAVVEQKERVDKVTSDVETAVKEMREGETKTRDEMREVREEVNNIREMLPKMIEKNKDVQTQSLAELQQELKSLKALLLSRGPTHSGLSSPLPQMPPRPSIPAWQLAQPSSATSATFPPATPSPPPAASSVPTPYLNGSGSAAPSVKGKEVAPPPPEDSTPAA